jgi:NitT/TauT family transport system substrate-binding protein
MNIVRASMNAGVVAFMLIAVAALTGRGHAADLPKGDGGKVRLLFSPFGTNSFPPFVMQKFKLDHKYGFELQTIPAATTQAGVNAIQAGGGDIGIFDWIDLSRMKNAGIKVVGVAPFLIWANTVVVPETSTAQNLGDLKGKRLGLYSRTNLDWIVMRAVAQKLYKLDLERDTAVQEGAIGLLRGLAEQGQLDALQMFNSLTPAMVASEKFRVLATIRGLINQLGLPDTPFLMYTVEGNYAAAHPANVKAFLAAYRESVKILNTDDSVWVERGAEMKLEGKALTLFRDEARADVMDRFAPSTEADIRKTFDILLATAGAAVLGMSQLPDGFMTLDYQ